MTYEACLSYIHSLLRFGVQPGLDRIRRLLERLGNPQRGLRCIHVAGTNGKGSTCTMLSCVLRAAGLRTGLYLSPYVLDFRERIQLDGAWISKDALIRCCETVRETGLEATEFEFITAAAFLYFAEQNCDVVVLETGLGGRLDATNAIEAPLACVLTKIGLDHRAVLGDTVAQIAAEKCGICKPGAPVISCCGQPPEALAVIRAHAPDVLLPDRSACHVEACSVAGNRFSYRGAPFETGLLGRHQIENALTVIETVRALPFPVPEAALRDGIAAARIPARLELLCAAPPLLLDGAHNPDGAASLAAFLKEVDLSGAVGVVGMMADKDCAGVLQTVLPLLCAAVTVAVPDNPRTLSAEALADLAHRFCDDVTPAASYAEALALARQKAGSRPVLIFGSLYLAAGIRPLALSAQTF